MTFAEERQIIETRFMEEWKDVSEIPHSEVAYENIAFDVPADTPWVQLSILNGSSGYIALNNQKRHTGVIMVQIFVPVGKGTSKARDYADKVATVFDSQTFNGVVCNVASIEAIGIESAYYQMNVSIPFWRDDYQI